MNLNIDAGKGGKKQKIQVDAPGKKRSTALLMKKEEGYCRCGSQPAALLIARLN